MSEDTKLILEEIAQLSDKIDAQSTSISRLETSIKDTQLTLENETNRNIQIIAENHLSLNQKLDDALKVSEKDELLQIRVNRLETEVRRLKSQIAALAN